MPRGRPKQSLMTDPLFDPNLGQPKRSTASVSSIDELLERLNTLEGRDLSGERGLRGEIGLQGLQRKRTSWSYGTTR